MSVINRIEVASLLNKHGDVSSPWDAKMRHLMLNLRGQSTAMNMENGFGKTTLSDALIGLLSRDRSLMRKTRKKMSPSRDGRPWTHLRVEFSYSSAPVGQQDILAAAGDSVGGSELWVFGLYGHSDTDPGFYFYQGRLEELPIHSTTADGKLQLYSNDHFQHFIKNLKPERPRDRETWLDAISLHISRKELEQLASFQKEGGADKSQIFNAIKPRPGEKADQAFFYEVLAPQVLAGASQGETDESEEFIEDLVINSGRKVSELRHQMQEKSHDLERSQQKTSKLEDLNNAGTRLSEARLNRNNARKKLEEQACCLHTITNEGLPGIPNAQHTSDDTSLTLAQDMAIRAGDTIPLIPASALSRICNTPVKKIRDYFESQQLGGFAHEKISIVYHPQASWASSKSMRLYPADKATRLILSSQQLFSSDADRVNAVELIQEAVDSFLDLDSNPFRENYLADAAYLDSLSSEVKDLKSRQQRLHNEREELEGRDKEFSDNETVYMDALKDGLFNEQELNQVDQTEKVAKEHLSAVSASLLKFSEDKGRFSSRTDDWSRFQHEHGQHITPREYAEEKQQERDELSARLEEHKELLHRQENVANDLKHQLSTINQKLPGLTAEQNHLNQLGQSFTRMQKQFPNEDIQGLIHRLEQQLKLARKNRDREVQTLSQQTSQQGTLLELQPDYQNFLTTFSGQQPEGLEDRLWEEKTELDQTIHKHNREISELEVLLSDLTEFQQQFPDMMPEQWLEQAEQCYPQLLTSKTATQKTITDIRRQLQDLENDPVSPSATDVEFSQLLNENALDYQPLHAVIDQLLDNSDPRKPAWLTQAHNLLFAPVLSNPEEAEQAAALFARQRIPVPVFSLESLQQAANTPDRPLLGAVVGYTSLAVKSLLDPQFIVEWQQQLQTDLQRKKQELTEIERQLTLYTPDSSNMKLAKSAAQAVAEQAQTQLPVIKAKLETLNKQQQKLADQLTPANRTLIRAAERYLKLGGNAALQEQAKSIHVTQANIEKVEQEIQQLDNKLSSDNRRELDRAEQFINAGGFERQKSVEEEVELLTLQEQQAQEQQQTNNSDLEQSRQKVEHYHQKVQSVFKAGEEKLLDQLEQYLQDGGPEFMLSADDRQQALEQQQNLAQQRANVKFHRIRAYLNARDDNTNSAALKKQIAEVKNSIATAVRQQEEKEADIEEIRQNQPQQRQAMHQVDETADRWLKQLAHFGQSMLNELPSPDMEQLEQMPLYEKAEAYREACSDENVETDQSCHLAMLLSDQLEQENIKELSKELRHQEKDHDEQAGRFREVLARIQDLDRQLFNATEHARLNELGSASSKALTDLSNMITTLNQQVADNQARLNMLQESMSDYEDKLQERLSSIIMHSVDNLRILRRIAKQSSGDNAYFDIQADIVSEDGIRTLVRSLLAEIEENQRQIRSRKARNLPVGSDEKQVKDLQKNLRNQIYRQLFTNISIRLKHNAIRSHGNLFSLNEEMSEGQREAVSLMWLVKLSEFAIERELKSVPSQYRRKERKSSESVIILDGLFSKLSHRKLIEDSLESLRNTRGRFQMVGLIHNPNYENDPGIFPTYLVGNVIGGLEGLGGHVTVKEGAKVNPVTIGRSTGEASLFHLHVDKADS